MVLNVNKAYYSGKKIVWLFEKLRWIEWSFTCLINQYFAFFLSSSKLLAYIYKKRLEYMRTSACYNPGLIFR
jgi:hypothetical protein